MRLVTLFSVTLAGLLFAAAPAGAAPPVEGTKAQSQGPSQGQPQGQAVGQPPGPSQGQIQAGAPTPSQAVPSTRAQGPGARASERRRRISYAACNRESHRRKLSGGARRRFLVRCRLGYERRPAAQPAPARRP